MPRVEVCPVCQRRVAVTSADTFYPHSVRRGEPCKALPTAARKERT